MTRPLSSWSAPMKRRPLFYGRAGLLRFVFVLVVSFALAFGLMAYIGL